MSFYQELKRRNVFRLAVAYIIVGWLVMQIGEVMSPALRLPDWVNSALAFFIILGFPFAIFFAWAFELTPEGLKKEKDVNRSQSVTHVTGRKLDFAIIGLLAVALVYFVWESRLADRSQVEPEHLSQPRTEQSGETSAGKMNPTPVAPTDTRKSIAVLPFINRSANEENTAFFSDGVHDEILTNLSKIGSLKVISRTSVMNYRDTTRNMREIGEELGVTALLEGGVQRAGNNLRINMQLIEAASDEHIWAETYSRELTAENVFAIQAEIAAAVAEALHAVLSPEELAKLEATPTRNLEALDHYLLAKQHFMRQNWDSLEQTLIELDESLTLDPRFQLAWELKAWTLAAQINTGARTLAENQSTWKAAVDRALELDPDSGWAHGALAEYHFQTGDNSAAATEYLTAVNLAPHNAALLLDYAVFTRRTGGPETALELLLRAQELDPMSIQVWWGLGRVYMQLNQPERATEAYARIRAIDPASSTGRGPAAGPYIVSGQIPQSLYWIFQGIEVDPRDMDLPNWVIRHYIDLEDLSAARAWLDSISKESVDFSFTRAHDAMLDVYDGTLEEAAAKARAYFGQETPNHRWGSDSTMVNILLMDAFEKGDPGPALEDLSGVYSKALEEQLVTVENVMMVLDIAHLLQMDGKDGEATALLHKVIELADQPYALSGDLNAWRASARAQALALLGENAAAIEELHKQVEGGWRLQWYWQTVMNPNFQGLADESEFKALVQSLHEDMATQLAEVRSMEASGEIPSPPEARS